MADVYDYVTDTGVIIPSSTFDIQLGVQTEYLNAFGEDLNLAPNTPQGLLITIESLSRKAVADNNATVANQINPNQAGGIFLDALMALTGSARTSATYSLVDCTITGVSGTSIPAGAQISNADGDLFELVATTVIPVGGSISAVPFKSVLTGAISGLAGTLTIIVSNILGWETVTNPNDAVLGTAAQSDVAARQLRQNALFAQGLSLTGSMISSLYLVPNVTSLTFQENIAATTETINGVSMVGHSIYTVVGGTALLTDIAESLTNTKSVGAAYNNGLGIPQSVDVTNQFSGQVIPVLFDTPSYVNISIKVTVTKNTSVQNIQTAVQTAITTYAAGGIANEPGFAVGAAVSPFQLAGAVNILVPGLFVQKVEVAVQAFTQIGTLATGMNTVTDMTYNSAIVTGMGVTDPLGYIPGATTVSSLVGSTGLTLSANATTTATEILTFQPASLSYQTTEIAMEVWQQATTAAGYITVIQV